MWHHQSTYKITGSACQLRSINVTSLPRDCFEYAQRFTDQLWFQSLCQNSATLVWYLLSLASRSMVPTTMTCCYKRRCCLPSVQSLVNCSSFSKTVHLHTVHVKQWPACSRNTHIDLWPPDGPDLNPVDYKVSGLLQEYVYKSPVKDMSELKQQLVEAWSAMPQRSIGEAINEWRRCLRCCVSAKGGHFEHKLWHLHRHCEFEWFCSACTFLSFTLWLLLTKQIHMYMHNWMTLCFLQ